MPVVTWTLRLPRNTHFHSQQRPSRVYVLVDHSAAFPSCPILHGIHLPLPLSLFTKLRKLTLRDGVSLVTNCGEAIVEDTNDEGGGERPAQHVPSPLHALRGTARLQGSLRQSHCTSGKFLELYPL
jgi:hypothetical protein